MSVAEAFHDATGALCITLSIVCMLATFQVVLETYDRYGRLAAIGAALASLLAFVVLLASAFLLLGGSS